MGGVVDGDAKTIQLAKQLASCYILRGAHLSVVQKIESRHIVQIQTKLLSWICKRIAAFQTGKNKKSLKTATLFFKVLPVLLGSVDGRDAMTMSVTFFKFATRTNICQISKANMDQTIAQAKIVIPATSKQWDSQRAYEKKLAGILGKDKGQSCETFGKTVIDMDFSEPGTSKKRKGKKSDVDGTSDEESEAEIEGLMEPTQTTQDSRAKPKPRPKAIAKATVPSSEPEDADVFSSPTKVRPKPRPIRKNNPSPQRLSKSPTKAPSTPSQSTPQRKRSRQDSDQEDEPEQGTEEDAANTEESRETTPVMVVPIRRKRVRH